MSAARDGAILSIDIGSSSLRASLYGMGGERISSGAKLEYRFSYSSEGAATVEPGELLNRFTRAIDTVLSENESQEIIAVGLSTFWHSLLGLDVGGNPTTEIITWADLRSARSASKLKDRIDPQVLHQSTGCPPHSSYWPAKLLWLKQDDEDTYTSTRRWASPGDYIYLNLFGRLTTSISMASATGLFDRNDLRWEPGILGQLGLEESRLVEVSDEPLTGLREEWASRWPGLADVPWYPAHGDGACSNVGSGCLGRDRTALMVGTSGAMRVAWDGERSDVEPGLWCYRIDGKRFVSGGALSDGGSLVEWVRRNFRVPDEAEDEVSWMKPDSHGLTFLPLLSGERGPSWSDRSNGAIAGLSTTTRPVEVLRAAMESVALRFALIAEKMEGISTGDARIVASGGGLISSGAWARIMADALGRTIEVSGVEEASSRGAALLALESLGYLSLDERHLSPEISYVVEPDAGAHQVYRGALRRQQELYEAIIG